MPSTKALAISTDRHFLRRMATGLQAAGGIVGTAESFKAAYPLLADAQVVFYHAETQPDPNVGKLVNVLRGGTRLVVLVQRPGIQDMIEYIGHDRVTAVASVGAAESSAMAGMASRNFYGHPFGVERCLPWGVRIHTNLVGDYHEKTVAMGSVSTFAREIGVRRKYLENIERVADELLMNALYDAPLVAAEQGLSTETPVSAGVKGRIVMQYACDGDLFALGVTDHYGALLKPTLVEYVSRCLTSARPLNNAETGSGAGLGLYLVTNSVSQLLINVAPGQATEVIALFDLKAPKLRLTHLAFNTEHVDPSRLAALEAPKRRVASGANLPRVGQPWPIKVALAAAIVVLGLAGGILLWNRLGADPPGDLLIQTQPPGADVSLNGTARGQTPPRGSGLLVQNLRPGRHTVVVRKAGYALPDPVVVQVRAGRKSLASVQLRRLPSAVKLVSSPPGARVSLDGKDRGRTPLVLGDLQAGQSYKVALALPGYQPETRTVVAPAPGVTDAEVVELSLAADWGQLDVSANVPIPEVLLDGKSLGQGLPLRSYRLPLGQHTVELRSRWPYLSHEVKVEIQRAGQEERLALDFGKVRPENEDTRLYWDGRYHKYEILLPVGVYTVKLKSEASGETRKKEILVKKGATVFVKY
jgi:hypothetical protein